MGLIITRSGPERQDHFPRSHSSDRADQDLLALRLEPSSLAPEFLPLGATENWQRPKLTEPERGQALAWGGQKMQTEAGNIQRCDSREPAGLRSSGPQWHTAIVTLGHRDSGARGS